MRARQGSEASGEVVVIAGPPAAGKTTVARALAEQSQVPSVHLHGDDFFRALKTGRLRGWDAGSESQHEIVYEAMASAVGVYARAGYFVVVDTVLRPRFVSGFAVTLTRAEVPFHYLVLRPSWHETLQRSRQRDAADRHDEPVLRQMYAHFERLGCLETHVIDTTLLGPTETTAAVKAAVESRGFCFTAGHCRAIPVSPFPSARS